MSVDGEKGDVRGIGGAGRGVRQEEAGNRSACMKGRSGKKEKRKEMEARKEEEWKRGKKNNGMEKLKKMEEGKNEEQRRGRGRRGSE